jgi:hypothetical protein
VKKEPAGKAKLEALLEAEGEALLKTAIARGRSGDSTSLKLLLERILIRDRLLSLADMPAIESATDLPRAHAYVVAAVASGKITPTEGNALTALLAGMRASLETVELAARIEALERGASHDIEG